MSTLAGEPTPSARRRMPRGRVGAVVGMLLLGAAAYGLSAAHVVGGSNSAPSGSDSTAAVASSGNGGSHGGTGAAAGGGSPGASASPSGGSQAGKGGSAGPGGHATPSPSPQATFDTSKTLIAGEGNWRQSNCEGGPEPGATCAVSYQGEYYLAGTSAEIVLMTATAKDGRVLAQQSYPAPTGGHRYGSLLKFTIPNDVHVVDMQAVLEDAQGHVIAKTSVQESYAA